jgi:hypothetical protein
MAEGRKKRGGWEMLLSCCETGEAAQMRPPIWEGVPAEIQTCTCHAMQRLAQTIEQYPVDVLQNGATNRRQCLCEVALHYLQRPFCVSHVEDWERRAAAALIPPRLTATAGACRPRA